MKAFLIFSLPNSPQIFKATHEEGAQNSIHIHSFDSQFDFPIQYSDLETITSESILELPELAPTELTETFHKESYLQTLHSLMEEMEKSHTPKVVFSITKWIEKTIHPFQTFLSLKEKNPNAFCYWWYGNAQQSWMGATPELLLKEDQQNYSTMSLAGTLPIDKKWTEKEFQEQAIVTQFIENTLQEHNVSYQVSPMEETQQAHFKHLKQNIQIDKKTISFSTLLPLLHPTPAVCGIPRNAALKLIEKWEPVSRHLYAGYISLKVENKQMAFVNIRCAQLFKNAVRLHIGSGITLQSVPENEWQEINWKADVMALSLN